MRRILVLAALVGVAACWPDAEESSTAEELLEDTTVIRAGTVAADSILAAPTAGMDTTARDTMRGDTARRVP